MTPKAWLQSWLRYEQAERLRNWLCNALLFTGVGPLLARTRPAGATVLVYHSVGGEGIFSDNVVSERQFERQIRYIRDHAEPVPLRRIVDSLRSGGSPDPDWVAVTFDDGYRDFITRAVPILERHAVPASFFVPTTILEGKPLFFDEIEDLVSGYSGEELVLALPAGQLRLPMQRPCDRRDASLRIALALRAMGPIERDEALGRLRAACGRQGGTASFSYVTTGDLAALPDLVELGSHSIEHYCLSTLDDAQLAQELGESAQVLAAICGRPIRVLAYPFGKTWSYDARVAQSAAAAGYSAALTTVVGRVRGGSDPFAIPRVAGTNSFSRFRLNLMGLLV